MASNTSFRGSLMTMSAVIGVTGDFVAARAKEGIHLRAAVGAEVFRAIGNLVSDIVIVSPGVMTLDADLGSAISGVSSGI